jgi:hypothetical protein
MVRQRLEGKTILASAEAALRAASTKTGQPGAPVPGWARIVLDRELFPAGAVWGTGDVDTVYNKLAAAGAVAHTPVAGDEGRHVVYIGSKQLSDLRFTPAALQAKCGAAEVHTCEEGDCKGWKYYCYGPLGFGVKPGDKDFSSVVVREPLPKGTILESARAAVQAAAGPGSGAP